VRLGVCILPELRWPEAREVWTTSEALGFDHAWTYDHLAWRSLRDEPWFSAMPTLAAVAVVTERMRLGTLVASPNFRHPVAFAREVLNVDDVSRGRFTLGIGAGGPGWDAVMLGQEPLSPRQRVDRFEEFVLLTDRLLREREVDHAGGWYTADGARSYPGCVQQPRVPLAIAATGRRSMAIAARSGDAWVTVGDRHDEGPFAPPEGAALVAGQLELLAAACGEVGRATTELDVIALVGLTLASPMGSAEELRDLIGHYEEVGVTDLVLHWPRPSEPFRGDRATFEAAVAGVTGA